MLEPQVIALYRIATDPATVVAFTSDAALHFRTVKNGVLIRGEFVLTADGRFTEFAAYTVPSNDAVEPTFEKEPAPISWAGLAVLASALCSPGAMSWYAKPKEEKNHE